MVSLEIKRLVYTINRFFYIQKGVFMNLYKYKGKRIRASDKNLVYRFCVGTLLLLFVAVLLLLNMGQLMRTDWEHFSLLDNGMTLTVMDNVYHTKEDMIYKRNRGLLLCSPLRFYCIFCAAPSRVERLKVLWLLSFKKVTGRLRG